MRLERIQDEQVHEPPGQLASLGRALPRLQALVDEERHARLGGPDGCPDNGLAAVGAPDDAGEEVGGFRVRRIAAGEPSRLLLPLLPEVLVDDGRPVGIDQLALPS